MKRWIIPIVLVLAASLYFIAYKSESGGVAAPAKPIHVSQTFNASDFLRLVNKFRVRNGLVPLTENPLLDKIAQSHAEDMQARNYYDHTTPDGVTAYQRIGQVLGRVSFAGENQAQVCAGSNAAAQFNGFMNSPEHKDNLLTPQYNSEGIGYISTQSGACNGYLVQDFAEL